MLQSLMCPELLTQLQQLPKGRSRWQRLLGGLLQGGQEALEVLRAPPAAHSHAAVRWPAHGSRPPHAALVQRWSWSHPPSQSMHGVLCSLVPEPQKFFPPAHSLVPWIEAAVPALSLQVAAACVHGQSAFGAPQPHSKAAPPPHAELHSPTALQSSYQLGRRMKP